VRLELHQPSADVAERLADPEQAAPEQAAKRRRSALLAAPEAEPGVTEPCTPAVARFAERSCAAVEAQMEEQPDAPH
jgi:hypothetical protein